MTMSTSCGRRWPIPPVVACSTPSWPRETRRPPTLARELPVTRQAVAKHLAVLDRAGLVEGGRQGREVRYAVRPERLDLAARSLARVASQWDQRLLAIKRIAESAARARERNELDQTMKEVGR